MIQRIQVFLEQAHTINNNMLEMKEIKGVFQIQNNPSIM